MNVCLINGQALGSLAISDRAIAYGDGVFETIAVKQGVMPFWTAHYQRLVRACEHLAIPIPNEAVLLQEIDQVKQHKARAVIKIIITRGSGDRGYHPPAKAMSRRIVQCLPWPEYPTEYQTLGVSVVFCNTPVSQNTHLAGIKHLNRLDNVLASAEWVNPDIAEGLMSDMSGHIIQGTKSNVFYVQDNVLHTPELKQAGVLGIMRAAVLEAAAELNIKTSISTISQIQLENADEIFLTNSIFGIWPVRALMDKPFAVGKITQQLAGYFE